LPFVATRGSSLTEVAEDAGILVDPHDPAGWTDAIRALLADRRGADVRAAQDRARANERFRWTTAAAALEAVYAAAIR
jgi:glycosyltransferase involved in cell wall biosynthesis